MKSLLVKSLAIASSALVFNANAATEVTIDSVFDDGKSHSSYPASNAIDDDTSWSSRWAAQDESYVNITTQLDESTTISSVGVAWGRGDSRTHTFEIYARNATSGTWTKVYDSVSSGDTSDIEVYDIDDMSVRQVRLKVFPESDYSYWANVTEIKLYSESDSSSSTDYGLDASVAPSANFDLLDWYLSVPEDEGDGYATSIKENDLTDSYEDDYFYTGSDGGMVFYTPVEGAKTSSSTKFTRTELREMLRRGDTSIDTSYDVDKDEDGNGRLNNWAFSSISSSDQDEFGGIDGELTATLAVNHVTTTSSNDEQVGRIVIGQIHAHKNEPIRLYYHKLPDNTNGAIYFAHETSKSDGGDETWYNLLGSMVVSDGDLNSTSNPSAGIALDEHFSYSIVVEGDDLTVTISQDGTQLATKTVDMSGSGYDDAENYMYFKAGIYLQDCIYDADDDDYASCDSDSDDYAQATFYELSNSHDNYDY